MDQRPGRRDPAQEGSGKKRLTEEPRLLWLLRLSLVLGRTPAELADVVTGEDLALYAALVEHDGPWWAESTNAHIRKLCAVTAAAAGVSSSADDYEVEWTVGGSDDELLPPDEGLECFAAAIGGTVVISEPEASARE